MSNTFHKWLLDSMLMASQDPCKMVREHLGRLQVGDTIDSIQPLNVITSGFSWTGRSTTSIIAALCSKNLERHMLVYMEPDNSGEAADQEGWIVVTDEITDKENYYAYGYDYAQWRVFAPELNMELVPLAKRIQEMLKTIGKQAYAIKFHNA